MKSGLSLGLARYGAKLITSVWPGMTTKAVGTGVRETTGFEFDDVLNGMSDGFIEDRATIRPEEVWVADVTDGLSDELYCQVIVDIRLNEVA